jgi:hypothetical protein
MELDTTARHECWASRPRRVRDDNGRFAVLGGRSVGILLGEITSSCEVLVTSDDDEPWEPLSPMHDYRYHFACEAVAGCFIVAGGNHLKSAEVYDEVLGRWLRLPRDMPSVEWLSYMGSALCRRSGTSFA